MTVQKTFSMTLILGAALIFLSSCQPQVPPGPTEIPTLAPTRTPSPTPSITDTVALPPTPPGPFPTLRVLVTATMTIPAEAVVVAQAPTATPTPICYQARAGDTLGGIMNRFGYNPDAWPAFRAFNGMCADCNNIEVGKNYCMPIRTPTPTPPGLELTRAAQIPALQTAAAQKSIITYTVKKTDKGILDVLINTGVSMRELCSLNPPAELDCRGCDLDTPLRPACRPLLREGQVLKIPGPAPTATITATFTGNETATPTPPYRRPTIISPKLNSVQTGEVQLLWLPVGILQSGEYYLIQWTNMATGRTYRERTDHNSFRMPADQEPGPGAQAIINWQIGIVRDGSEGDILISPLSDIYTFIWQRN